MRGTSDIKLLRLEVLQEFVERYKAPPSLILSNMFPSRNADSSTIKWESQRGGRGMTPFVPPGAPAPVSAGYGIAQHSAEAAYWKEKRYFDEEVLNNLRKPGTDARHWRAAEILADNLADIMNRSARRKEWMFTQMLFSGSFTYEIKGGYQVTVNYQIPSDHQVTLATAYDWNGGGSKNILSDIKDAKLKIAESCGGKVDMMFMNSQVLNLIGNDTTIRQLLYKSNFGDGNFMASAGINDLALVNADVLQSLFGIPNIVVYDEMYEAKAFLTAAVTGGSTTWLTVSDASDFEANEKIWIYDASEADDNYETRIIYSVDKTNNRIQLEYPPTNSYKAGEDFVMMQKYFVPSDKVAFIASNVEGKPIARYYNAPFGMGRHYGRYTDKHDEWDPEGTWVRVQDKGLPVLLNRDAVYTLDVTTRAVESITTTSTTTTSSSTTTTTA